MIIYLYSIIDWKYESMTLSETTMKFNENKKIKMVVYRSFFIKRDENVAANTTNIPPISFTKKEFPIILLSLCLSLTRFLTKRLSIPKFDKNENSITKLRV